MDTKTQLHSLLRKASEDKELHDLLVRLGAMRWLKNQAQEQGKLREVGRVCFNCSELIDSINMCLNLPPSQKPWTNAP